MIAALQGDLNTSDGVGKVFFRQDASPSVLRQAAEHINRAFPEDDEVSPTHTVIVTWADVATNQPQSRGDSLDKKVSIEGLFFVRFCEDVMQWEEIRNTEPIQTSSFRHYITFLPVIWLEFCTV